MGKLIIDNRSETLTDQDACRLVMRVIEEGRVSNEGKQYCYLTSFNYGVTNQEHKVVTDLNKNSDRFVVYDAK